MVSSPVQMRHVVDRAVRIACAMRTVTCIIVPNDVQEMPAVEKPPRAHGTIHSGIGYSAPRVIPTAADLARAAAVLNQGKRVAMLVGAGAMAATDEVIEVAELLGAVEVRVGGDDARRAVTDARVDRAVRTRRLLHRRHLLHDVGHADAGYGAHRTGAAPRAIDDVAHLHGARDHLHVIAGHVLEQRHEIDLLLIMAAERGQLLLADDGHHRLMAELRVVETVQQMDRTRSRGREAHADLAGELRMRAGQERGHFLMARLHEGKLALAALERAHNAVDAVAGITVYARNAPLLEPLQHEICGGLAHGAVLMVGCNMTSRPQDGRR